MYGSFRCMSTVLALVLSICIRQLQAVSTPSFLFLHSILDGIMFCLGSCPYGWPKYPLKKGVLSWDCMSFLSSPYQRIQQNGVDIGPAGAYGVACQLWSVGIPPLQRCGMQ